MKSIPFPPPEDIVGDADHETLVARRLRQLIGLDPYLRNLHMGTLAGGAYQCADKLVGDLHERTTGK